MPYWNLRVIEQPEGDTNPFSVHEVYYNDDGSIYAYGERPAALSGESIEELRKYCQKILDCLEKPPLVMGEIAFVDFVSGVNIPTESID